MTKKQHVGTLDLKALREDAPKGHDYGKGRGTRVLRHRNERRSKDRLRHQIQEELR